MIPYNTDAPLYHLPLATVGLIVLNTVLFFAVPSSWLQVDVDAGFPVDFVQVVPVDPEMDPDWNPNWDPDDFQVGDADGAAQFEDQDGPLPIEAEIDEDEVARQPTTLILEYGVGLKPWQWVSSMFMHIDFFHLLFNMNYFMSNRRCIVQWIHIVWMIDCVTNRHPILI